MFRDPKAGVVYLSIADVARRWECRPENVSRFHVRVGGLETIDGGTSLWVPLESLQTYEQRLAKATEGKIKKLKRLLSRLALPVEKTL